MFQRIPRSLALCFRVDPLVLCHLLYCVCCVVFPVLYRALQGGATNVRAAPCKALAGGWCGGLMGLVCWRRSAEGFHVPGVRQGVVLESQSETARRR